MLARNEGRIVGKAVWPSLRKARGDGVIETAPRPVFEPIVIHEVSRTSVVVEEEGDEPRPTRRAWLAAAGLAVPAALAGGFVWSRRTVRAGSTMAVLPFRPIGSAPPIGLGCSILSSAVE